MSGSSAGSGKRAGSNATGNTVNFYERPGYFSLLAATGTIGFLLASPAGAGDFNAKVKPLLSQHCFTCHGPDANQRKGNLRLDVPPEESGMDAARLAAVFGGGAHAGLIRERITTADSIDRMPPPEKAALTAEEVDIILQWLEDGAPYEKHWAFVPPGWPEIPAVDDATWPQNEIDHFVLARLEAEGIEPAPPASPETRLRRVYLDLIGLQPTLDEVDAFLADPRADAYAEVVDTLLASPHFGERWGRYWLDGARYADSNGYSIDGPREIWPYRDWVIDAVNADMPFNQFVVEQLAGDLLPEATRSQKVATGFHRNTMINQEGGIDVEEFRIEAVVDRVNTTGDLLLGLTLACAKCHDHKYDPIYHTDYYRLFAFYNNDDEVDLSLPSAEDTERIEALRAEIAGITPERDAYQARAVEERFPAWIASLTEEAVKDWGLKEKAAIRADRGTWTDEQEALLQKRFLQADAAYQEFEKKIGAIQGEMPKSPKTMVLKKRAEPRETRRFEMGDFTQLAEVLQPGTPGVLHEYRGPEDGTRLDLANWIVARDNPLTARVTVNRHWQYLFGRGIVETENDFGYQGALPTHPELLDYLANRFIARGWSVKESIREMVLSATYQQASVRRPELEVVDPQNYLLARQNRVRLDAEIIRDVALNASGLLNPAIGGPSVFPPLPDGVMTLGQSARPWAEATDESRFRRGMYTYFWRATPHPSLTVFDAPDATVSCTRRGRSNTPLQALTLLNDAAFFEQAEAFAGRIAEAPMASEEERLRFAFRVCMNREPEAHEVDVLGGLLADARAGGSGQPWLEVARTLFNLDEFITRE